MDNREIIKYEFKLKTDAKVLAYEFVDEFTNEKYLWLSPVAVKHHVKKQLREVYPEEEIFLSLEDEMFGYLELNRGAKAGKILFSQAICNKIQNSLKEENGKISVIPKGSLFKGEIHNLLSTKSKESLALRMSLLTLNFIGEENNSGYGQIDIRIDDPLISTEKLYSINSNETSVLNKVLKNIHQEIQNYYGRKYDSIKDLSPRKFEKLIASIFVNQGFDIKLTKETRDKGYDIIAIRNSKLLGEEKYLVECKRYDSKRKVGVELIRNIIGVTHLENATKGIIVTTSDFSKDGRNLWSQNKSKIQLINFKGLITLLNE